MTQIEILFEDEHFLVINKPAGFIVNRADTTTTQPTIQAWMEERYPEIFKGVQNDDFYARGGVVHRLDKETSGLLILAKNPTAFGQLQRQFKEGAVEKTYTALVHGFVKPETGEINVPIGRLPWNRMRFGILPDGRASKTLYKTVKYVTLSEGKTKHDFSLVEAYPKTGRTHQIRVHFQYLGHPLFADSLYAGRKNTKRDRKILERHFLHAKKITFDHPITGEKLELESKLPQELLAVLALTEKI